MRAELPPNTRIGAEKAVRSVFELLSDKIDRGEVAKLIDLFPAELRDFWPRLAGAD